MAEDGSKKTSGEEGAALPPREPARPRKRRRRRRRFSFWRLLGGVCKLLGTLLLIGVTTGVLLASFAAVYVSSVIIPDAREWVQNYTGDISMSLTSTMYYTDENGANQPYLTISSEENREFVPYNQLPKELVNAVIAIEDKRFPDHNGVDWLRTGRGVLNMFTGGSIQGGSTITQQLIKNLTGERDTTVKRKVTEIFRALEFDKAHSKEQTIEWYLNYIYFGEASYGVGAASWAYFGKDVRELTLAECASLAGILNNPSRYDPYLNKNAEVTNDAANRKRAKLVLWNMKDQGMIDSKTYAQACEDVDTLHFKNATPGGAVGKVYTWYQDQVIDDVIRDLMDEYGWTRKVATHKVYYGGLSIYTNVDMRIQAIVDEVYEDPENLPYVSKTGQQMQSAIVIVDHAGRVVALSGGVGEKKLNRAWSRASDTVRPPGSSIKPLAVYAPAIEMGRITPNSIVDDAPYTTINERPWPGNAVGYFKGLDTVKHAVAQSSNTVAVRVLGDYVTPQVSYEFLESRFHISSLVWEKWINNHKYSDMDLAPLALGGLTNGVSLYEMAAAYNVFPTLGRYVTPRTYSKVLDADGVTVLLDRTWDGEYVLEESTAFYMNQLLREVVVSGTARDAAFEGMTIAGKTGTTTSQKDLWFVGYTNYYTAAVWTGYDRQEQLGNVGHPQNLLWKKVMEQVHEGLEDAEFALPSATEAVTARYCLDSGLIPTEACAQDTRGNRVATGTFLRGDQPTRVCNLHTVITVCTDDPVVDEETQVPTGAYHRAGAYCPEESRKTFAVVNHVREGAAAEVSVRDGKAMVTFYPDEPCQVHTVPPVVEPPPFDPADPTTWPLDDPDFNIYDPDTWPTGGSEEPGQPGSGGAPSTPEPSPVQTPGQEAPPVPMPGDLPPNEPYLPV